MPRGKDKTQRKRRTRDEIQADKEENRRRLEATRARAIERQAAAASNPHPEPQFKHMHFNLCDGGDYNIGSFEALLEDSVKETAEGASVGDDHDKTSSTSKKFFEKSDFGRYAVLLMKQLQFECSKRENANGGARNDGWSLLKYLEEHKFWLRAEAAPSIAKKLGMPATTKFQYFRDIKVWLPDIQWGLAAMPCCTNCGSNQRVHANKFPFDHPMRRIVSIDDCYFILSRQYYCASCKPSRKACKPVTNKLGHSMKQPEYAFMATHSKCLQNLRPEWSAEFPAVLSHKSGLDRLLYRLLRPLFDASVQAEGVSNLLLELHSLKYFDNILQFLSEKERDISTKVTANTGDGYSSFDDPYEYAGAVPSPKYILDMYKKQCHEIRPFLENEVKKVECETFHIDSSKKAPKKICQHNGKSVFGDLITATNGDGEVRLQFLVPTDAHDQLIGPMKAYLNSADALGQVQPKYVVTDNVPRDRPFMLETCASLRKTQEHLDNVAAELNERDKKESSNRTTNQIIQDISDVVASKVGDYENSGEAAAPTASDTHEKDPIDRHVDDSILRGDESLVIPTTRVNDALAAMLETIGAAENGGTFAIDLEWPTKPTRGGGKRKNGNVGICQIGYKENGIYKALILQLPRKKIRARDNKIPGGLKRFLCDRSNKLIGVNLLNDFKVLAADFDNFHWEDVPPQNVINVSAMARDRDLATRDNESMHTLGRNVLSIDIDKNDEIRCSDWARQVLTSPQIRYAALDVVRPYQMYEKLLELPDLASRLSAEEAVPEMIVDIAPPYVRTTRKAKNGYNVTDIATRAATGRIVASNRVTYPDNIEPRYAQSVPGNSVVVEVSQVYSKALKVPEHRLNNRTAATLGDFGDEPFKVVLPLTMLRRHIELSENDAIGVILRTYEPPRSEVTRNRTRPSSSVAKKAAPPFSDNRADTVAAEDRDECLTSTDEDWDDDDDVKERIGSLDKLLEDLEALDGDEDRDATHRLIKEHLETLRISKMIAEKAEEGDLEALFSEKLGPVPDEILYKFSAVLGDVFHAIQRTRVPVKHEYKKALFYALMNAFFVWDEVELEKVKEILREKARMTDEEITSLMYYSPEFFQRRVQRHVPGPRQLYYRVRAVYCAFGNKIDSKTNRPLFNAEAWTKARQVLKEILQGYYSDPPGFSFYTYDINEDGSVRRDKWGIKLLLCRRGTNLVENIHRTYNRTFRRACGFELGDCLLAERRHRHNTRMARRRRCGYPKVGHYDTWLIDRLKLLTAKVMKKTIYESWTPSILYRDTPETFVTVAIHSEELGEKLDRHWNEKVNREKVKLTPDQKFYCSQTGVPLPFLPVDGAHEYSLFNKLLHDHKGALDSHAIALLWIDHVDGISIFPKIPAHLRTYYKHWERNVRIKSAEKEMEPERQALERFQKKHSPVHAVAGNDSLSSPDERPAKKARARLHIGTQAVSFPAVRYPHQQVAPSAKALRDFQYSVFAGNQLVWRPDQDATLLMGPRKRGRKKGSTDGKQRQQKMCRLCREQHGKSKEFSSTCPGRNNRRNCVSEKEANKNPH